MTTATDTKQAKVDVIEADEVVSDHMPNEETIQAIRDLEAGVDVHTFHDMESMFRWLHEDD